MPTPVASRPPLLIVGVTGRALAASAARAGRPVVVLDYFADRDTRALARSCRAVAGRGLRFDRRALFAAADELAPPARCAGLVYGSGFEGRVGWLSRLSQGRRLYGNPPDVVASVRDPGRFFGLLDRLGVAHPEVRLTPPRDPAGWLVKRPGGAGGAQVRRASGRKAPAGAYFQRFERGRTLSALFLANGKRACVLGINEQWISPARPGLPFLYGGAVGGIVLPAVVDAELRTRLDALVAATGLVGLNGVDFLLRDRTWSVLELNPRPTATAELYDADYPRGLLHWHLRACDGELPFRAASPRAVRAHSIVHAFAYGSAGPRMNIPAWCRDIPEVGTRFAPGDPVCTVHAAAADTGKALALLRSRQALTTRVLREAAA
jgi:predicted ATP-grasp superfamily ATP-dependent carboligase